MTLGGSSNPHAVGSWRHEAFIFVNTVKFRAGVLMLVVVNCILLAIDVPGARYYDSNLGNVLNAFDTSFIALFSAEAAIKIFGLGPFANPHGYFRSGWNCLDFLIVVFGLVSIGFSEWEGVTSLRVLRIIRPLRSMAIFGSFSDVLGALVTSMHKLTTIFFLFVIFSLVFGVIGVQVFGGVLSHHCMAGGVMLDTSTEV